MGRQNQFSVTLVVGQGAERRDLGIWSAAEGGGVGGDPSLHYPGAMRPAVSLGSDVETDALTLRKLEADLTDDDLAFLLDIVGSATPAVGSRQRRRGRALIPVWVGERVVASHERLEGREDPGGDGDDCLPCGHMPMIGELSRRVCKIAHTRIGGRRGYAPRVKLPARRASTHGGSGHTRAERGRGR
jgi:hypothetical protein